MRGTDIIDFIFGLNLTAVSNNSVSTVGMETKHCVATPAWMTHNDYWRLQRLCIFITVRTHALGVRVCAPASKLGHTFVYWTFRHNCRVRFPCYMWIFFLILWAIKCTNCILKHFQTHLVEKRRTHVGWVYTYNYFG